VNARTCPGFVAALLLFVAGAFYVDANLHRPPPAPTAAQLFDTEQSATVLIRSPDGGEATGFMTHSRTSGKVYLWTAGHVADSAPPGAVFKLEQTRKAGGFTISTVHATARVLRCYPKQDIALLEVLDPSRLFRTVVFQKEEPPIGAPVILVGNFQGDFFPGLAVHGYIVGKGCQPKSPRWPWTVPLDVAQMPATPGVSGGALFDSSGKVVGVLVGTCTGAGISAYVPTRDILKIATENQLLDAVP
jgi:S1-C subfamily serine protease